VAELSRETISGAERLGDTALRETIASAAERKARDPSMVAQATVAQASAVERRAFDLPAGSLAAMEDEVRAADTPVADTDRSLNERQRLDQSG
jgi:hypothetical protein